MSGHQSAVRDHFHEIAGKWNSMYVSALTLHDMGILERHRTALEMVDTAFSGGEGKKALDLGSGAGQFVLDLAKRGFHATGVDFAENMVKEAEKHAAAAGMANVEFVCGDVAALEFPKEGFDLITALGFLEYCLSDAWILRRVASLLKPGGVMIVSVPNNRRLAHYFEKPLEKLYFKLFPSRAGQKQVKPPFDRNVYRPLDLDALMFTIVGKREMARGAGFAPPRPLGRRLLPGGAEKTFHETLSGLHRMRCLPFGARLGASYLIMSRKDPDISEGRSRDLPGETRRELLRYFRYRHLDHMLPNRPWADSVAALDIRGDLGGRILTISPHPDDSIIGAGGILSLAKQQGAAVHEAFVTDGYPCAGIGRDMPEDEARTLRLDEGRRVCDSLGFECTVIGKRSGTTDDAQLKEWQQEITGLIRRFRPTAILTPAATDRHEEHRIVAELVRRGLREIAWRGRLLEYEVWGFVTASRVCDVAEVFHRKAAALWGYRIGMMGEDYIARTRGLGLYRAKTCAMRSGIGPGALLEAFGEVSM